MSTEHATVETSRRALRAKRWRIFLAIALILHIPLFAYPVLRLSQWLELSGITTLAILIPIFFSQIFARVYLRGKSGKRVFVLRSTADLILGLAPIALLSLIFFEVCVLLFNVDTLFAAQSILLITCCIAFWGVHRAFNPVVKKIELSSGKLTQSLRFVQISDVHIGSRSIRFLKHIIARINRLDADFLCITGDFIDQPGITADKLKSLQSFRGPIYFSIGNHEKYEDLDDIVQRLESLGVLVLRNRSVIDGDIQFIGIDDREDSKQVAKQLNQIPVESDKYVILLYHRPKGLEACRDKGVDLMLSGHTHGGQIIPFNMAVNRVFERRPGLHHLGNASLYVSEGTGTWGPVMRVGTMSEITFFEVKSLRQ